MQAFAMDDHVHSGLLFGIRLHLSDWTGLQSYYNICNVREIT